MSILVRTIVLLSLAGLLACDDSTPPAAEAPAVETGGGETPAGPSIDDVTTPDRGELDESAEDPYGDEGEMDDEQGDDDASSYDDDEEEAEEDDEPFEHAL
jgi:hypothetical protein